jgi:fluoroquinolone resistance protein
MGPCGKVYFFFSKNIMPHSLLRGEMSQAVPIHLERQAIKLEYFSKKSLEDRSFTECLFESCDFSESVLRHAKFYTCTFVNCNLSLMKLDGCSFQEVQFVDCKLMGAEFFKCDRTLFSVNFKNCLIQYCNFAGLNMKNCKFAGSRLKNTHFINTILVGANFDDVDLMGTIFHDCDLCKADFSRAARYDIDPRTNKIKKAKFSIPDAMGLLRVFDITIV